MNNASKYLLCLAMLYITSLLLSTIFVYKMMIFLGIVISTGTFILPVSFWLGDIIAEVYGFKTARQIVISGLICLALFDIGSYFFVMTPAPDFWDKQIAFETVLTPLPRIFFADIIGFFLGSITNVYLVSKWRVLLKGRYFWLRSIGASFIGELVFTILVMAIIFFGTLNFHHYLQAVSFSICYKLIFAFIASFFGQLIVLYLKYKEGVNWDSQKNPLTNI